MLEHLVVRKMKDEFKDGELDSILKYGAKEIFDENPSSELVYDEAAILKLLDRRQATMQKKQEEQNGYLNSFKVARVWETEGSTLSLSSSSGISTSDYWDTILKERVEKAKVEEQQNLGKGKRRRGKVVYKLKDSDGEGEEEVSDEEWEEEEEEESEEEGEEDLEYESGEESPVKKKRKKYPPHISDSDHDSDELAYLGDGIRSYDTPFDPRLHIQPPMTLPNPIFITPNFSQPRPTLPNARDFYNGYNNIQRGPVQYPPANSNPVFNPSMQSYVPARPPPSR